MKTETKFLIMLNVHESVLTNQVWDTNKRYDVFQIKAILEMVRGIKISNTKHVPLNNSLI